jgi:hypothetical protein
MPLRGRNAQHRFHILPYKRVKSVYRAKICEAEREERGKSRVRQEVEVARQGPFAHGADEKSKTVALIYAANNL